MTPQQFEKFSAQMEAICTLHGKNATPEFVALYWQLLKGYELQDVTRAIHLHCMNPDGGQFMPKPADIVRYIDGNGSSSAGKAWAKVMTAVGRCGQYSSVVFDDAVIHAVLSDLGGWPKLCQTMADELPFVQNRFEKLYQGYRLKTELPVYPRYLVGLSEADNRQRGYKTEPPVPIGNTEACRLVYKGGSDQHAVQVGHIGGTLLRLVTVIGDAQGGKQSA